MMRASLSSSRQSAVSITNSCCVGVAPSALPRPQRSAIAALRSGLANSTPAQFSSFHGAKMFLPELFVSRIKSAVAGRKPVQMSFLGVGAPEAVLVGVVALVVFGPKGLAEAAKSLGKTLRAFQPTIREVVEASQDIRGTLEQELGINELRDAARAPPPPPPRPPTTDVDEDIEAKRKASAAAAWGTSMQPQQEPQASQQSEAGEAAAAAAPLAATGEAAAATPAAAAAAAASPAAPGSSLGSTSHGSSSATTTTSTTTNEASGSGSRGSEAGSSLSSLGASLAASQGSSNGSTSGSSPPSSAAAPAASAAPTSASSPAPAAAAAGQGSVSQASMDNLSLMSVEELEAELARRKQSSS